MSEDLLTINVSVAERNYPILIKREEEEDIRKAVKLLNDLILGFKEKYPLRTDSKILSIDYLAMAAIQLSMKYIRLNAAKDINLFAGEIDNISKELEDYLKSEK